MMNEWSEYTELTYTSEDESVKSDLSHHESNFCSGQLSSTSFLPWPTSCLISSEPRDVFWFCLNFPGVSYFYASWEACSWTSGVIRGPCSDHVSSSHLPSSQRWVLSLATSSFVNFATFWEGHPVLKPDLIFFFYLGMSEPSFSAPFFKWPDVHWFQVSSLFLDLASEKKILQGMHWVMFSPCIMHVQTIFSS